MVHFERVYGSVVGSGDGKEKDKDEVSNWMSSISAAIESVDLGFSWHLNWSVVTVDTSKFAVVEVVVKQKKN